MTSPLEYEMKRGAMRGDSSREMAQQEVERNIKDNPLYYKSRLVHISVSIFIIILIVFNVYGYNFCVFAGLVLLAFLVLISASWLPAAHI
jgi:hypothetical protein